MQKKKKANKKAKLFFGLFWGKLRKTSDCHWHYSTWALECCWQGPHANILEDVVEILPQLFW